MEYTLSSRAVCDDILRSTTRHVEAIESAVKYARSRGWNHYMIRHDSPAGQPRTEQGGFLVELTEIAEWVEYFTNGGVCMLLEPLDPLCNGYNISCLVESTNLTLEVAGPGFDASDLQRGHISPHETLMLPTDGNTSEQTNLISDAEYQASVKERVRKIWWKIINREISNDGWRELDSSEERRCRELILKRRGSIIPVEYEPVPNEILDVYLRAALPIVTAWQRELNEFPAVLASSFVQDGSLCFWDVNTGRRWINFAA